MDNEFDLKNITPLVSNDLFKFINEEIRGIIKNICKENKLEETIVLDKYNLEILNIGAKFGVKKRNRRVLPQDKMCMGRKLDGKQCTRGRKADSDYCKSHMNKLPFGDVRQAFDIPPISKRGRKKKTMINKYIVTHIEEIGGSNYLVDDKDWVYSFNVNDPRFLGVKMDNKILKIDLDNNCIECN